MDPDGVVEVMVGGGEDARCCAPKGLSSSSSGGGGGGGGGGKPPMRELLLEDKSSSPCGDNRLDGRLGGLGAGLPLDGGKGGTLRVGAGLEEEIDPELGLLGSLGGGAKLLGVAVLDLGGIAGGPLPLIDEDEGTRSGNLGGNTEGLGGGAIRLEGGEAEAEAEEAGAREGTGGGGGLRCVVLLVGEAGIGGGATLVGF